MALRAPVGPDRRAARGRGGGIDPTGTLLRSGWDRDLLFLSPSISVVAGFVSAWPSRLPSWRLTLGCTPPGWDLDLASPVLLVPCTQPATPSTACRLGLLGRASRPRWSAACRGSVTIAPGLGPGQRVAGVRDRGPLGAGVCGHSVAGKEGFAACGRDESPCHPCPGATSRLVCGAQESRGPAASVAPLRSAPGGVPPRALLPSGRAWPLAHT